MIEHEVIDAHSAPNRIRLNNFVFISYNLTYFQTHHCQVIVYFSPITVLVYLGLHDLYHLLGCTVTCVSQIANQTFLAKLLLLLILCLVQSIGIKEHGTTFDGIYLFTHKLQSTP